MGADAQRESAVEPAEEDVAAAVAVEVRNRRRRGVARRDGEERPLRRQHGLRRVALAGAKERDGRRGVTEAAALAVAVGAALDEARGSPLPVRIDAARRGIERSSGS